MSEPLGTAAEEAGRLMDALREWLDARGVPEAHLATGAPECRACPVCLLLASVRDHHPEVVDQLGRAGAALIAAARALLADEQEEWMRRKAPDVERIDIDD